MRIMFYVFAAVALLFGLLGLFRTFEHLLAGDGLQPTQLVMGVLGIALAVIWFTRARSTVR